MDDMTKPLVLSLCDRTGNMVRPWVEAGYPAITVDIQAPEPAGDSGPKPYRVADDIVQERVSARLAELPELASKREEIVHEVTKSLSGARGQ